MLTKNEISSLNLSPTKKDFVQIWNELLEIAGKLSERWDPTSTNESDPGIVILKALTGIADKLNYNIDKNTLEAFMPTAAQEDSMRKLCDMLGYNIKYYRSATTDVTIKYYNQEPEPDEATLMQGNGLAIPKFTVITNNDKDISYFTLNPVPYYISSKSPTVVITCMEGQLVKCESTNDNDLITVNQISEGNRFYLPETQIAENGIFVYNVLNIGGSLSDGAQWKRVDNLNIQARGTRAFKFGFDSYESRPYIEFPEDYSELFNDGIFVYYARTHGISGNVSPRTLTQFELPKGEGWDKVSASSFSVENILSATEGANIETINQAYNNFKKTVGTFETLVTCRDYMNRIYSMVNQSTGKPYVSNILVTDIRNDLNRAITICSSDDAGIFYKETPLFDDVKTVELNIGKFESASDTPSNASVVSADGTTAQSEDANITIPLYTKRTAAIDHFDLVFYPFKSYNQIRSGVTDIRKAYDASFEYTEANLGRIETELEDNKTLAHKIKKPRTGKDKQPSTVTDEKQSSVDSTNSGPIGDIISINNYLRLSATIATNSKITVEEGAILTDKIKIALANAFNMRELDFGEEIPFDSIVSVIENADTRIRVASLNEPALYTTFTVFEGRDGNTPRLAEYAVASDWLTTEIAEASGRFGDDLEEEGRFDSATAKKIYNKLAVRNVLAGRLPLFNYYDTFKASFSEGAYQKTVILDNLGEVPKELLRPNVDNPFTIWTKGDTVYTGQFIDASKTIYTKTVSEYPDNIIATVDDKKITQIDTTCELPANDRGEITEVLLAAGETIKFRAPNFITTKTYPAYVNYHLQLKKDDVVEAKPAVAESLFDILNADNTGARWQEVLDYFANNYPSYKKIFTLSQTISALKEASSESDTLQTGEILVSVENIVVDDSTNKIAEIFTKSSCVKLVNEDFTAKVEWSPAENETKPINSPLPEIKLDFNKNSPFVTDQNLLVALRDAVDDKIASLKDQEILPKECSWTISFDFEYVPFEAATLKAWEGFINASDKESLGFTPVNENGAFLWRLYGEGYELGKYILEDTRKLLRFTSSYFGLLSDPYLKDIYLAKDLGRDAKPASIKNDEEYKLRDGECLYIEYTPSTTTDEGTTQTLAAVTEIHGPGTILRPSGFEADMMDSSAYESLGNKAYKEVKFTPSDTISMQRFGANERVELREPSEVSITRDSFSGSDIYVYKNFNDCPELEKRDNETRSYTLKDGEYIFYTDNNKAELAYYTSGTQVELEGNIQLPKCDIIDLSVLFDLGPQEIPWKILDFKSKDAKITFQEYQYITLGAGDTLKCLTLVGNASAMDGNWKFCKDVEYCPAGASENTKLPAVNLSANENQGDGWQVSSDFELDVSANEAQTLRTVRDEDSNVKLKTSVKLSGVGVEGQSAPVSVPPLAEDSATNTPKDSEFVSIKTNLPCQTAGKSFNIKDVLSNPKKLTGFELKVFSQDEPTIVKTALGKVVPHGELPDNDITKWSGKAVTKATQELWYSVELDEIKVDQGESDDTDSLEPQYDNALRLSINTLPNTYGVFCINVKYAEDESLSTGPTWIEVIPGTDRKDLTILNAPSRSVDHWELAEKDSNKSDRLLLHPGINCICVNKTCKLFIKTSNNSRGTLFFDELRLVNCQKIGYKIGDTSVTASTLGLNLDQLAYQLISNEDDKDDVISEEVRSQLQALYVARAHSDLERHAKERLLGEDRPVGLYQKLLEEKPKIASLIQILDIAAEELSALSNRCSSLSDAGSDKEKNSLITQLTTYKEVRTTLNNKKALLKALEDGKDIDELEQQLIDLLKTYESQFNIGTSQQQLLKGLEELRAKVSVSLEQFLAEDNNTLNHFKSKGINEADILNRLHNASREKANAEYEAQLVDLAARIERVVNSSERGVLSNAINSLQVALLADTRAQLLNKINQLSNAADSSGLESLLDTAYNQASQAEHLALLQTLEQLREFFKAKDYESLIAELTLASSSGSDAYLSQLVEELSALLASEDPGSSYSDFLDELSVLYSTVQSNITKTETVSAIITGTLELRELALSTHESRLSVLLDSIAEYLSTLTNPDKESIAAAIAAATTNLQTSQDSQVDEILNELTEATSDYGKAIELLDTESTPWDKLPFANELVEHIWAEYLKQKLASELDILLSDFSGYIKHLDAEALKQNHYAWPLSMDVFHDDNDDNADPIIDDDSIQAFFKQIQGLAKQAALELASKELIANISNTVQISSELSNALTKDVGNSVITELIGQLRTDGLTVRDKQQLKLTLKAELTREIETDLQLISILANLLYCPTLFSFEVERSVEADDSFYQALCQKFNMIVLDASLAELGGLASNLSNTATGLLSACNKNRDLLSCLDETVLTNARGDLLNLFNEGNKGINKETLKYPERAHSYLENTFLLSNSLRSIIISLIDELYLCEWLLNDLDAIKAAAFDKIEELNNLIDKVSNLALYANETGTYKDYIDTLLKNLNNLRDMSFSSDEKELKKLDVLRRERQLLADIQVIDFDRDFYYTVPIENSLAIDFNESDASRNNLMNPLTYYNINNINNNFVISKLDIDYLDEGIKLARSSRLN